VFCRNSEQALHTSLRSSISDWHSSHRRTCNTTSTATCHCMPTASSIAAAVQLSTTEPYQVDETAYTAGAVTMATVVDLAPCKWHRRLARRVCVSLHAAATRHFTLRVNGRHMPSHVFFIAHVALSAECATVCATRPMIVTRSSRCRRPLVADLSN